MAVPPASRQRSSDLFQRLLSARREHDERPCEANAIAVARPIPLEAPVTTTTWRDMSSPSSFSAGAPRSLELQPLRQVRLLAS